MKCTIVITRAELPTDRKPFLCFGLKIWVICSSVELFIPSVTLTSHVFKGTVVSIHCIEDVVKVSLSGGT